MKTLLLVEDNPDEEMLAIRALQEVSPVDVLVTVHDCDEALDYVLRRGAFRNRTKQQPSVVLLDLELPGRSGLEVLREIRANPDTKDIPVVVFSSSGEPTDVRRSYELGANSFVEKPLRFEEFLDTIRQLGTYWLSINRGPVVV